MKKVWSVPEAVAEQFVADESVAACFYIACSLGEQDYGRGTYLHHTKNVATGTGCGHKENQAITVISGDINSGEGVEISIKELNCVVNGTAVGTLQCYFSDSRDVDRTGTQGPSTLSGVVEGQEIYWVTDIDPRANNTMWMLHRGVVQFDDANHPNRS